MSASQLVTSVGRRIESSAARRNPPAAETVENRIIRSLITPSGARQFISADKIMSLPLNQSSLRVSRLYSQLLYFSYCSFPSTEFHAEIHFHNEMSSKEGQVDVATVSFIMKMFQIAVEQRNAPRAG